MRARADLRALARRGASTRLDALADILDLGEVRHFDGDAELDGYDLLVLSNMLRVYAKRLRAGTFDHRESTGDHIKGLAFLAVIDAGDEGATAKAVSEAMGDGRTFQEAHGVLTQLLNEGLVARVRAAGNVRWRVATSDDEVQAVQGRCPICGSGVLG